MCDETIGETTITCTAEVEYAKTGPAPMVDVVLAAELADVDGLHDRAGSAPGTSCWTASLAVIASRGI